MVPGTQHKYPETMEEDGIPFIKLANEKIHQKSDEIIFIQKREEEKNPPLKKSDGRIWLLKITNAEKHLIKNSDRRIRLLKRANGKSHLINSSHGKMCIFVY